MKHVHGRTALTLTLVLALADSSFAQPPRPGDDVTPFFERKTGVSKSDAHRVVGKVLEIDRGRGRVKLQTDEGTQEVRPTALLLNAVRVGDTISVPRTGDEPASASPRGSSPGTTR